MRISDDRERAFREAVAGGESVEAAIRRLKVPKPLVKFFTKRLPQPKAVRPCDPAIVARSVPIVSAPKQEQRLQPISPPAPEQDESDEGDTDLEDITDGDV